MAFTHQGGNLYAVEELLLKVFAGICCVFHIIVGALSPYFVSLLGDRERSVLLTDWHTLLCFPVL